MIKARARRAFTLSGKRIAAGASIALPSNQYADLGPAGAGLVEMAPAPPPAPEPAPAEIPDKPDAPKTAKKAAAKKENRT